ncbi:replication protein [Escherichia coli]|nr:replication protein [Escherichia coli]EES0567327.1 replication protein [Escherichia coli]EIG6188853.1 replication protein [Escherichia coli]EJU0171624.1 replication protein [Escherichia coli]EKE5234312.1 replication protein [Escherichia coli]EKE5268566.1 replication protein [Escherichia coli]
MSLLMTSQPIVINRDLACRIGLNEAIVLQQLHYWLNETNSGTEHGGIRWVYNTTEQWLEQFPFWSESTLKRTFASLKSLGVLRREQLNKSKRDMTNFYTINYESELLEEVKVNESIRSKCTSPSGQSDLMDGRKMTRSIGSKRHAVIGSKWPNDLTENTTEITSENTTESKNTIGASADASAPARSARQEYSPEFEQAWQEYPKRAGGNSKSAAFKAWKARIREGIKPETMLDGVKRYAAWVRATGNTGTQFVKQAATFFGPDRHFEDYWQQPAAPGGGRQRQVDVLAGLGAMSDKFGKSSDKLTF